MNSLRAEQLDEQVRLLGECRNILAVAGAAFELFRVPLEPMIATISRAMANAPSHAFPKLAEADTGYPWTVMGVLSRIAGAKTFPSAGEVPKGSDEEEELPSGEGGPDYAFSPPLVAAVNHHEDEEENEPEKVE